MSEFNAITASDEELKSAIDQGTVVDGFEDIVEESVDEVSESDTEVETEEAFEETEEVEEELTDSEDYDDVEVESEEEISDEDAEDAEDEESDEPEEEVDPEDFAAVAQELNLKPADLKQLFAPFKAAGREMQVRNVQEAIALMQQGVGFSERMRTLKPYRKAGEMLKAAGLLRNEERLALLIDASTGDADAVAKLIAEAKIDPLDITTERGNNYKRKAYMPTDTELTIRDALEEVKKTPSGQQTISIVQQLDPKSRQSVLGDPVTLSTINDHVASGVYEKVMAEVERRRLLSSDYDNVPDLQAYKQVGQELEAAGQLGQPSTTPKPQGTTQRANGKAKDSKLKARKKAAQVGGRRSPTSAPKRGGEPNWAALTDEEFAKAFEAI